MEIPISPELQIPELKKEIERLKQELAEVNAEHVHSYNLYNNNPDEQNDVGQKLSKEASGNYNDLYRNIIETANEGIWVSDPNIRTIFVNQRLADMLGYSKEEILGKSPFDFMDEEAVMLAKKYSERRKQGQKDLYEQKYIRKDGSVLWTMLSASPIYDKQNNFTAFLGLLTDITERKRAEDALREIAEKFSAAFRTNPYAIVLSLVEDGTIIEANDAFLKLFERTEKEVIGKTSVSLNMFANPEDRERAIDLLRKEGRINNFELKIKRRSGEERIAILSVEVLLISGRKTMLTTIQDITERKQSEVKIQELLRLAERQAAELNAVIESMPDAVYIGTKEGITQCNGTALKMLGAPSLDDLQERIGELGKKFNIRWPDSGRSLEVDELQFTRALKGETVIEEVLATNVQTGEDIYIRVADAPVIVNGEIIGAVAINTDMTERKKSEDELRRSREELKTITDNSPDVIARFDREMRHTFINPYGEKVYGKTQDEIIGKSSAELGMSADKVAFWKKHFEEVLVTGEQKNVEFDFDSPNFGHQYFHSTFVPEKNDKGDIISILAITRDITNPKRSEEALRLREAQLDAFFANSPAILNLVDENFCYINTDKVTPTYYGLNRETIKGKCVPDLSRDFIEQTGGVMRRVIETGEPILNAEFEAPVPGRDGEIAYWHTSFFRVPLGNEKWGVGVISIEVTDIKRSEVKLRESEERFHTLADNISQFAWMADVSGSIFWYNKRWYDYTGTTFEDMKGWGWMKVHHPDHVNRVIEKFKKAIEAGDNWEDTFPILGKDNSYRWYLSRALPISDENNNIILWFGTNTDITEQKLAEEKLQAALLQAEEGKNTLTALMEYIPLGITIADAPDVNIRMVSRYGQDILEKTNEEIAGIPAPEHPSKWGVYRPDGVTPGIPEELPLSRATMKGEIVKNEEWFVSRKDGTLVPILCNAAPILNKDRKVVGGIIGWQDIADLKKIEQEMKQRNEELTRFIYTVSHDLKSPLVTIKMFTTYLRDDIKNDDNEEKEKDLNYIENAADKMGRLLDELLELSRIGRKEQYKTEVTLEKIVQDALDLVAGRIREKNVEVVITAPPILLFGFYQRLIQLFQNLLDNAAKFMGNQPSPHVEIGAFTDNKEVVLFVRDNGSGIDPRYHNKLFGLFEKLDPASEGTGIGLALVKRIVEVHEGRMWFTSEGLGKGTTFYFTLGKTKILNKR